MNEKILRDQLKHFLTERLAHVNLDDVLDSFPVEHINAHIPGITYTAWELLEHMRITQDDIIKFLSNSDYEAPNWPDDYWPKKQEPASEKDWNHSLIELKRGIKWLKDKISKEDLFQNFTDDLKYTLLREVLIIIDHNSHHLGQMILFRKFFKAWK
jgi:uncharacterized damage-inducible protein DinB